MINISNYNRNQQKLLLQKPDIMYQGQNIEMVVIVKLGRRNLHCVETIPSSVIIRFITNKKEEIAIGGIL